MTKQPTVKILVGYHKPAKLYKDDVLVPIHLGRALATQASKDGKMSDDDYQWMLNNMIGDDTGDNISHLNRYFCELSGIYWAWKNYDKIGNPDYIGFMHYRRLFADGKQEVDYHFPIKKFDFDICTPEPGIENPYEHVRNSFVMDINEYNDIIESVKKVCPDYSEAVDDYHNGNKTYCCNMFIMKKDLFFDYCKFIFTIMMPYVEKYDFSNCTIESMRNPGRYCEWLTGIFFTKFSKKMNVMSCETRLVTDTDILQRVAPLSDKKAIPVVFATDANYYLYLGVAIKSLIANKNANTKYDIIILEMDLTQYQKDRLRKLSNDDVSIRVLNVKSLVRKYQIDNFMTINHIKASAYYRLLISEILPEYKKVIYLDCDLLVLTDLSEMYGTHLNGNYAGAVKDYHISRCLTKTSDFAQYAQDVLNIKDLDLYFNSGVLILNLDLMRTDKIQIKLLDVAKVNNRYFHDQNVLNSVFYNKVVYLDGSYNVNYQLLFSGVDKFFPASIWHKYLQDIQSPKILHYASSLKPWTRPDLPNADIWWTYARMTPFYEEILYQNLKKDVDKKVRDLADYTRNKFLYWYYKLLSKMTLGNMRKYYKKKRKELKINLKQVRKFLKGIK